MRFHLLQKNTSMY